MSEETKNETQEAVKAPEGELIECSVPDDQGFAGTKTVGDIKKELYAIFEVYQGSNPLQGLYAVNLIGGFLNWLDGSGPEVSKGLADANKSAEEMKKAVKTASDQKINTEVVN